MDIKKMLTGGIVGGVAFFLLGYLIYGMLLMNFMSEHMGAAGNIMRAEEDMQFLYLAIGNLAQGFLLAYILVNANVNSMARGLVMGAIVGFLVSVSFDCIMYGTTTTISKTAMAADVVAATAMTAIVGSIIGFVLGMGKKEASS